MPNEIIHKMQAEQNERLARGLVLLSPQFLDWGTTACFYAAIHFVESYLARDNIHSHSHIEREELIQRRFRPIRRDYWRLKRHSIAARYRGVQINSETAFQPTFIEDLINIELGKIKDYIDRLT